MLPEFVELSRPISVQPDDPILISVVRNESLRLPYFLSYYRSRGLKNFVFIDNDSDDETREFLLSQPDVTLYHTTESYRSSNYGTHWISPILNAYCHDRWALCVDADELLVWPNCENETIQDLISRLDELSAQGLFTLMLDMYSDKPFGSIGYAQGMPFLAATPFFDRKLHEFVEILIFPMRMTFGGLHARTFTETPNGRRHPPIVSKVPLVRWRQGQKFGPGTHTVTVPITLAPMRGALLHFKLFDNMHARCEEEIARNEHHANAREYKALKLTIERAANNCFFDPQYSVRYEGTSQLMSLGFMNNQDPFADLQPWVGPVEPAQ
jgi:Glycosyl transferase family 2